jgi:hypothetical protein
MKKSLALAAVALAAALPLGAAHAHGNVAIRVDTPDFGIRIGTPFPVYPPPVIVAPAPVYAPPPVIYAPPPAIYAPAPRVIVPAPVYYVAPGFRPPGHHRKHHKFKDYDRYDRVRHWYDD